MGLILIDSSIWIDHLRRPDPTLILLIAEDRVLQHQLVTAELALGSLANRASFLAILGCMRQAEAAPHAQLLAFITDRDIHGTGIGVIDAHLLLSAILYTAQVWTRDRRLQEQAQRLHVSWPQ